MFIRWSDRIYAFISRRSLSGRISSNETARFINESGVSDKKCSDLLIVAHASGNDIHQSLQYQH